MKLYAASQRLAELERCAAEGLCEGVVVLGTGAAAPLDATALAALASAFAGPILVDVDAGAFTNATALASALAPLGGRVAARVPFGAGGPATISACRRAGLFTNAVACAGTAEALAAGRAGASWVSPALTGAAPGAPSGGDLDALRQTRGLFDTLNLPAELLVGPLRDASALLGAAVSGAHAACASPAVLRDLGARATM